jgi:hypothetical protein
VDRVAGHQAPQAPGQGLLSGSDQQWSRINRLQLKK